MLAKRIIPCLDIKGGQVVKGQQFENVVTIADPLEIAKYYSDTGADELIFYDIMASTENRGPFLKLVSEIAKTINIPFTIGGGVKTIDDFDVLLKSGADKVSINTQAFLNPSLIKEASLKYGAQCVVLSVDIKKIDDQYIVFTHGGRNNTGRQALDWIQEGIKLGAGELCINSIDADGSKKGFDIKLLKLISDKVSVPIIASGGAGCKDDFVKLFNETNVSAGLAASIFHTKKVSIPEVKFELKRKGIPVRNYLAPLFTSELIPAIVQSGKTKVVLMLAYVNKEALQKCMSTGYTHFYSRSRKSLWFKGETSGNKQALLDIRYDCDQDTLLMIVDEEGPACHTGSYSCFETSPEPKSVFNALMSVIEDRKANPIPNSYTNYLFEKGIDKILKKVGEESAEVIIGAKNSTQELVYEMADLFYHNLVLLANQNIPIEALEAELQKRFK